MTATPEQIAAARAAAARKAAPDAVAAARAAMARKRSASPDARMDQSGVMLPPRADDQTPIAPRPSLDQRIASGIAAIRAPIEAVQDRVMEGMTFGAAGDEFRAGIGSAVTGKPYDQAIEQERARDAAFKASDPALAAGAEVAGAIMSPTGPARSVATAIGKAALGGAAMGFAEGEGGVKSRATEAAKSAAASAAFGAGGALVQKGVSAGLARLAGKVDKRPSVEGLGAVRTRAYAAVDAAGEKFSPEDLAGVATSARAAIDEGYNFFPETDIGTAAALSMMDRIAASGKPLTLGQLDKARQGMWTLYRRHNEPGILDVIGHIDGLVESRAGASQLMAFAREANAKYRKSQLLENAFDKARLQTAATGSGGNILNKYRQAVTSIVTNQKESKWFSDAEIAAMEAFVKGSVPENIMRRIGKLAPGGNGLMQALNLAAIAANPAAVAVSAGAQGFKYAADKNAERGAAALQDMVGGYSRQAPIRNYGPTSRASGNLGAQSVR